MANQNMQQPSIEFSESELDVARQLVQLSGSNSGETSRRDKDDDDGTNEACSAPTEVAGAKAFAGAGEDDEGWAELKRKTRKFRSIQLIYNSTEPLFPQAAKKKKKIRWMEASREVYALKLNP